MRKEEAKKFGLSTLTILEIVSYGDTSYGIHEYWETLLFKEQQRIEAKYRVSIEHSEDRFKVVAND